MIYDLRQSGSGYELTGGLLDEPHRYGDPDAVEYTTRIVGFLAQVTGAELRVSSAADELVGTKRFRVGIPPSEKTELGNV
ncbi:MAG: hypothetical protein QOI07_2903 [Verrucomicrobiota bacterium]|jgi:hypothetical protein